MNEQETGLPNQKHRLRQRLANFWEKTRGLILFLGGIAAALLAVLIFSSMSPKPELLTEDEFNDRVLQAMASATEPPPFSAQVYQLIQPSLVLIETRFTDSSGKGHEGLGSGVVVNDNGEILTSLHVVDGAVDIRVTFADGTEGKGEVIAAQAENDIAVVSSNRLPEILLPAILGNANSLRVGDEAYPVGNPFGLYSSMSAGVISGFGRTFHPEGSDKQLEDLIQFDAAVNPGNSGGPLLNRFGQVVGIVVGIVNPTDEDFFVGIGFAVPINIAGGAAGVPPY